MICIPFATSPRKVRDITFHGQKTYGSGFAAAGGKILLNLENWTNGANFLNDVFNFTISTNVLDRVI